MLATPLTFLRGAVMAEISRAGRSPGFRCRRATTRTSPTSWIVLLDGNDGDFPLFLQYKEAQRADLALYVNSPPWDCEGRRVVVGQRLIQGAPDIFLGWGIQIDGTHFYMRQLRDTKGSWKFDPAITREKRLPDYCKLCGWAPALAHAKSGDAAITAGYLGANDRMDDGVARFAFAYAEQTDRDYDALVKATRAKRIPVATANSR